MVNKDMLVITVDKDFEEQQLAGIVKSEMVLAIIEANTFESLTVEARKAK